MGVQTVWRQYFHFERHHTFFLQVPQQRLEMMQCWIESKQTGRFSNRGANGFPVKIRFNLCHYILNFLLTILLILLPLAPYAHKELREILI